MKENGFVLVTGGAGFIGSHTCLALLEKGYGIIVIDSFVNSSPKSLDKVKQILQSKNLFFTNRIFIYRGTLKDKEFIFRIFSESEKNGCRIDSVIHFAGLKSVEESIENPLNYYEENVLSTINLLIVMSKFFCKEIVFSSSATIYKPYENQLINEGCQIESINPYASTKIINEQILSDLHVSDKKNWKIMNLRYFNPIGAHPSGELGESPKGSVQNLFPLIMQCAIKKNVSLKIFGKDWPTKDGTCIRDYIHIMDLAEGHIKALEFLKKNKASIFNLNLGTGIGTSVMDLIKVFEHTNKVNLSCLFKDRRKGDLPFLVADNKYAKYLLNWSPSRSLEQMCRDGWNWKLKNPNGY